MKSIKHVALAAIAAAAIFAVPALAKDSMMKSLEGLKGPDFDHTFVSHMIEHHQQGVMMAEMAVQRAQRSEVKQFAQKTIQEQQKEIEALEAMHGGRSSGHASSHSQSGALSANSDTSHHGKGSDHQAMKHEMMTKLERAQGPEFDRQFVETMTQHHQMAVEMAKLAERRASAPEVKSFAEKTVTHQQEGIKQLKRLKQ
ncbi:MAG: hypothetical protein C0518_06810 [Opitutus sp.]|nr:hypothetical protein [Opitutus sp.]